MWWRSTGRRQQRRQRLASIHSMTSCSSCLSASPLRSESATVGATLTGEHTAIMEAQRGLERLVERTRQIMADHETDKPQ